MHMVVVHAPASNVGVPWKPTLHTHADACVLFAVSSVALFAGHAVQLLPVVSPSPYVLVPHEHLWVPGPVCVQI